MSWMVMLFTAVGLSMDSFAVTLASGSSRVDSRVRHALKLGLIFGLVQMLMPIAGWLFGSKLKHWIGAVDHWIAFGLLVLIGLKMLTESLNKDHCAKGKGDINNRSLFLLAVVTSIDALIVGVTFAFLDCPIFIAALLIGVVTFLMAAAGALIGCFCCCVWGRRAEMLGGLILILLGLKILMEHLF